MMLRTLRLMIALALLGSFGSCTSESKTPTPDDRGDDDQTGDDDADDDTSTDEGPASSDDDADSDDDDDAPPTTKKDGGTPNTRADASLKLDASSNSDAAKGNLDSSTSRSDATAPASDASSNAADSSAEEPTSCSKPNMWKAGDTNATIMIGNTRRSYILHVPASYKGDKPVPLLIDSHPMIFGTAASQRRSSGYAEIADREGFIVAYGDGIDNAWNMGPCCTRSRDVDDYGFMTQLVQKLKNEGCIDSKRVYAAGYSNGGGLTFYLACKYADIFAAIAPAAFDMIEEVPCMPSRPISVIHFRGTADTIVPARAHESTPPTPYPLDPIHFLGPEGNFKKWAELNGCTGEPVAAGTNCRMYSQCKGGVETTLCLTPGGGHVTGDAKYGWEHMKKYTLP